MRLLLNLGYVGQHCLGSGQFRVEGTRQVGCPERICFTESRIPANFHFPIASSSSCNIVGPSCKLVALSRWHCAWNGALRHGNDKLFFGFAPKLVNLPYFQVHRKGVVAKCTLNPNDISGVGDQPMSRRKSFKKSLRESFRRLRKGRSQRPNATPKTIPTSPTGPAQEAASTSSGPTTAAEVRPVERQIEARPVDDGLGSMVRCLLMAKTYVISQSQQTTPTLWAGTNSGAIYVFNLVIPAGMRYRQLTEASTNF